MSPLNPLYSCSQFKCVLFYEAFTNPCSWVKHLLFCPSHNPRMVLLTIVQQWSIFVHCCYCLVAELCLTLLWPPKLWPARLLCPGISQARILDWVDISFSRGIFLTHRLNPRLLPGRQILYHWATTREARTSLWGSQMPTVCIWSWISEIVC